MPADKCNTRNLIKRIFTCIMDMIMSPGIDGLEAYEKITSIHPDQKAIIVSGFSETTRVNKFQQLGAGAYVRKPYSIKNIGNTVKSELEKEAA